MGRIGRRRRRRRLLSTKLIQPRGALGPNRRQSIRRIRVALTTRIHLRLYYNSNNIMYGERNRMENIKTNGGIQKERERESDRPVERGW